MEIKERGRGTEKRLEKEKAPKRRGKGEESKRNFDKDKKTMGREKTFGN